MFVLGLVLQPVECLLSTVRLALGPAGPCRHRPGRNSSVVSWTACSAHDEIKPTLNRPAHFNNEMICNKHLVSF